MIKHVFSIFFLGLVGLSLTSCGDDEQPVVVDTANMNLDSLIQLFPDSVPLLIKRGNRAVEEYRYADALIDGAKAFRLDTMNLEARMLLAMAQNNKEDRSLEDIQTAQRHFQYIIKQEPKNTKALVALATTYGQQQDIEKAFEYVDRALRIDQKMRDAYVYKGSMFLAMGKTDLAKSSYETAVQLDPTFFEGYLRLATIYHGEEDSICLEYYKTAYSLNPEEPEALYSLAYAEEYFGHLDKARTLYRKMAEEDMVNFYESRGYFHLGSIKQHYDKDLDSALFFYSRAIQLNSKYIEAYHNRGYCYELKGDKQSAFQEYSKALVLDEEYQLSLDGIKRVK